MNEQREKVELSEGRRVLRGLLIMLPAMLVIPLLMNLIAEAVIPGRRMGFDYHSGPGIFIVIGYPLMLVWIVKPRKIIRFWLSLVGPLLVFYVGGIALVCAVRGYSMDWGKIALEVGVFTPVAHVVGIGWIWVMGRRG